MQSGLLLRRPINVIIDDVRMSLAEQSFQFGNSLLKNFDVVWGQLPP
jgi:hypothetical protein